MLAMMRLAAISLGALVGLAQSSVAQSTDLSPQEALPKLLKYLRIDEIMEGPAGVVVRASRMQPNGRIVPDLRIICGPSHSGRPYLAVQDHTLKTDDRWGVEPGFCDAFLATVRQRKDAQER